MNVTLLFSREQYIASAEAYMRGIERRIAAGRDPKIHSVASVFISRWDKAVMGKVPETAAEPSWNCNREDARTKATAICWNRADGGNSPKPEHCRNACCGAAPEQKIPQHRTSYIFEALAAPDTINTIPEKTLLAFADHGQVKGVMPRDGGDAEDRCWPSSHVQESMLQHSRLNCSVKGPKPSISHGTI